MQIRADDPRLRPHFVLYLEDRGMTFGKAIDELYAGIKMRRNGWNGPNRFIELQVPDEHSKMTLPYIYITTEQGDLVPWLASQADMLSDDWERVA